jgi:sigma-54 dependent transcriptional regulator, flagellar regulatory protein
MVKHFAPLAALPSTRAVTKPDPEWISRRVDLLIPGKTAPMVALKKMVALLVSVKAPVLVQGPSGAGKELVAQALHNLSGCAGNLVAVNCAAVPADLMEGEFFGAERGAYTGADRAREGLFEQAQGGTLFLDEIGDLPLNMQAKLLRVLETRAVRRLGGTGSVELDFRLVAATHRDLAAMVKAGTFREDLYFRLSVFPLKVPALSERLGDLPLLLQHLLEQEAKFQPDLAEPVFDATALRALASHNWSGNIRELKTLVQRACVLFPGRKVGAQEVSQNLLQFSVPDLDAAFWPDAPLPTDTALEDPARYQSVFEQGAGRLDLRSYLRDIELAVIGAALDAQGNCVSRAADALGLRRTTLIEKMRKYGMER